MLQRIIVGFFIIICLAAALGSAVYIHYKHRQAAALAAAAAAAAKKAPEQTFRIDEGWTNNDIEQSMLNQNLITDAVQFIAAEQTFSTTDYPLLASKPAGADLEGFLFPDTYFIAKTATTEPAIASTAVIEKALNNFTKKFTPAMQQMAAARNMSVYQIITLASIVEKEAGGNAITETQKQGLDEERKIIAGIFYNRLAINMALQSDATVNFVTHKNTPSISAQDEQINSPYNTYMHTGLPPGPISNPSLSSIMAALQPEQTDYYYFLNAQPSGMPVYAKTLQEQEANKAKYLP